MESQLQVQKELEFLKVLETEMKDFDLGDISNEKLFKDLDAHFETIDKSFYLETLILQEKNEEFFLLVKSDNNYCITPNMLCLATEKNNFKIFHYLMKNLPFSSSTLEFLNMCLLKSRLINRPDIFAKVNFYRNTFTDCLKILSEFFQTKNCPEETVNFLIAVGHSMFDVRCNF